MRITFDGGLCEHMEPRDTARALTQLLEALVTCNMVWLRQHPETPHPYEAGIRYMREPRGEENWRGIEKVLHQGGGDCEDLACYLAAVLRHRGEAKAKPVVIFRRKRRRGSGTVFHIVVRRADGKIEDPSLVLGMGS